MVVKKKLYKVKTTYCDKSKLDDKVAELRKKGCKIELFGIDYKDRGVIKHSILTTEIEEKVDTLVSFKQKEVGKK